MRSFEEQRDFRELLLEDGDLAKVLSHAEIEKAFDLHDQMRNVDVIFARVFGAAADAVGAGQGAGSRTRTVRA